jgi:hypothetical protein
MEYDVIGQPPSSHFFRSRTRNVELRCLMRRLCAGMIGAEMDKIKLDI